MMTDYLLLTLAVTLLTGCFAMSRLYQRSEGAGLLAGFRYTALLGAVTGLVFFGICGFSLSFTLFSLCMAISISGLVTLYTLIGFRLMRSGGLALYTMFLMAGGMIVPYVWGLIFWNEEFSALRTVGLLLLLAALILANLQKGGGGKVDPWQIVMCLGVFFLNGFVSVCSKLHQVETVYPTVSTNEFVVWSCISKFILAGMAWIILSFVIKEEKGETAVKARGRNWFFLIPVVLAALFDGASYMLQLSAASTLPATVMYPFVTGGGMILSALSGILFFREKLNRSMAISLCLCFAGTLLFL